MRKHRYITVGQSFVFVAGRSLFTILFSANIPQLAAQSTDVLTYHNDSGRTGQNLHEEILAPTNVNFTNFGLLRILSTVGRVDAEPLYAAGVSIPGKGVHNVLFVATEHDNVYA